MDETTGGCYRDISQAENDFDVHLGDIRDPFLMKTLVKDCDIVFHLAALIGIPYSYVAPQDYVAVNVQGTLNVLEACREKSIRMIHTSTSETYGTAQYVPIDENTLPSKDNLPIPQVRFLLIKW